MWDLPVFQHQAVRDLAWSCFGPNLIDTFAGRNIQSLNLEFTAARQEYFQALDQNPDPLFAHLSNLKSRRLGLYFEALWKFFLLRDGQLELIAHNVPIRNAQRTLGELDVICLDRISGEHIHLELSVKFYLNTQTTESTVCPTDFLGPNCRDRLDKKLDRLLGHQSPLSDTPEAKQVLAALGVQDVQKRITIKGQLFYHGNAKPPSNSCPPLSVHHVKGHWLHVTDFQKVVHEHEQWVVLDKKHWLSPATILGPSEHALLSPLQLTTALTKAFHEDQRPRLVCPMIQADSMVHEAGRYFITPDQWPIADVHPLPSRPTL